MWCVKRVARLVSVRSSGCERTPLTTRGRVTDAIATPPPLSEPTVPSPTHTTTGSRQGSRSLRAPKASPWSGASSGPRCRWSLAGASLGRTPARPRSTPRACARPSRSGSRARGLPRRSSVAPESDRLARLYCVLAINCLFAMEWTRSAPTRGAFLSPECDCSARLRCDWRL
jgi:hypothetical protein